jgi:hypothetical protein
MIATTIKSSISEKPFCFLINILLSSLEFLAQALRPVAVPQSLSASLVPKTGCEGNGNDETR